MRIADRLRLAATALALVAPGIADAEWLEASSRHFVIYSDTREAPLRQMATELEQFDAVIRRVYSTQDAPEAASNRVTIYVTDNVAQVQRLCGTRAGCRNVYGFYQPRAAGSAVFTPRASGQGGMNDLGPRTVLYHEYGHHFLLGSFAAAYPAWFSEGFAEFVSTTTFDDKLITVGRAANHRAYGLFANNGMSTKLLFAPPARLTAEQHEAIYGRGWLLTHYTTFDPTRRKQFGEYLDRLNNGTPSLTAATETFGDLKQLDRDLDRYLNQRRLSAMMIPRDKIATPTIAIRQLSAGEAAMIGFRMQSDRGVDSKSGPALYARAAPVAARYPNDPVMQGWLAEMAFDAGQDAAAEAAADRALARDPKSIQALLYKARVRLRALDGRPAEDPAWGQARSWIIKANRADTDNADALQTFYVSFLQAKAKPAKSAVLGLERAYQLVPQDPGLRFALVRQLVIDERLKDARLVLAPLAFDPHAGADNPAARLIAMMDAGSKGSDLLARIDGAEKATEANPPVPPTPAAPTGASPAGKPKKGEGPS